jgi:hypothetical protein
VNIPVGPVHNAWTTVSTGLPASFADGATPETPSPSWESSVADLLIVALTAALFVALTVLVKAVERG